MKIYNVSTRAGRSRPAWAVAVRRNFASFLTFIALAGGAAVSAHAATYYIDPAGNNANAGTSTASPWFDFTNVNATTFVPGDKILLKRGATWNQHFQLHGSGTSSNFIEVGAYGTGNRPKIQRNGNVADRCLTTYDVSYVKISSLEVAEGGAGIIIHYDKSYNHQSVYIDDIVAHGFVGIKRNSVHNAAIDDAYLIRGTNGWEGVQGTGHSPDPALVSYYSPDHVAFSYGIGVTGAWDTAHNNTTMLNDIRITNCEVYQSGCGIALDWNDHSSREGYFQSPQDPNWNGPKSKCTNVIIDNAYIHDIQAPWVSLTALFMTSVDGLSVTNSKLYKGAYYQSGGTSQMHIYLASDVLIDNLQVRTSVNPTPTTTDLSIGDLGGIDGLEIRNSTFENIAGYGFGLLYTPTWTPSSNINLNIHDNTFINVSYKRTGVMNVFNLGGSLSNTPTGTIHDNHVDLGPDVSFYGGYANWGGVSFYKNDSVWNISSGNDLAVNKSVTASSSYSSVYLPSEATDGDESSRWASVYSGSTQWIQVDLGAVMPINEVKIKWQAPSYALKYEIRVSADGISSETVRNNEYVEDKTTGTVYYFPSSATTDDLFTTRFARYIKVEMTRGNDEYFSSNPNFSIYSLSVFNSENVAQGRTATASSTTTGAYSTPDKGNDGDDASRWTSGFGSGSRTYTVDLGVPRYVNEAKINWGDSFAKAYSVAVAPDNITYTNVASRSGISSRGETRDLFPLTSARYVKVTMTQGVSADPVDYSIAELRVFGARSQSQDVNASASSTTTTVGYDVQRAVDANGNTRWSSAVSTGPASFKVDLGGSYNFNEVITAWDTAYAKDYTISTSTDDSSYSLAYTSPGVTSAGTTSDKFTNRTARYVRLDMTQGYRADPTNYSIYTVQVLTNLARTATVTASSTNATYPVGNAVDTSDLTRWSSTVAASPQWLKLDLGAPKIIDRVLVKWETAYGKDYNIQVSSDNVIFTTVASRVGIQSAGVTDDKLATPVSARYVKINLTKGYVADPVNYSLFNVSIYGPHP